MRKKLAKLEKHLCNNAVNASNFVYRRMDKHTNNYLSKIYRAKQSSIAQFEEPWHMLCKQVRQGSTSKVNILRLFVNNKSFAFSSF